MLAFSYRPDPASYCYIGTTFGGSYDAQNTLRFYLRTAASAHHNVLTLRGDKVVEFPDAVGLAVGTATGTKIGTATHQKLGFWNAPPVVQPAAVADATEDLASVRAQLNALLSRLRDTGLLAAA